MSGARAVSVCVCVCFGVCVSVCVCVCVVEVLLQAGCGRVCVILYCWMVLV